MFSKCIAVFFFGCVIAVRAQFYCSFAKFTPCDRWDDHHVECGTDGVTYKNRCEFTKAHCLDNNIHVAYTGACPRTATTGTTRSPIVGSTGAPLVDGSEAAFDFFCTNLSHMDCPATIDKVCGNDKKTYNNMCEYEKAKCTHRELHVQSYGDCSA